MSRSGRTIALNIPRRIIGDLMYFAKQVPSVPVQRQMNLQALLQARQRLQRRPSWVTLFTKAYAIVSQQMPMLRRSYLSWPYARLYEHTQQVASVAIEREFEGEPSVWFARLRNPHLESITRLDAILQQHRQLPLNQLKHFRRLLTIARLWRPLRRFAWALAQNVSGIWRERYFGTFGVSVYSGLGVESLHPLSPLTTTINYGVIGDDGRVQVRIIYDHRVIDGATVGRALLRLERVLTNEIVGELQAMHTSPRLIQPDHQSLATA